MRRLLAALGVLATAGASTPAADAAKVTKLRVTTAPSWEQWIEREPATPGPFGLQRNACSRLEPHITYTLAPTTDAERGSPSFAGALTYVGASIPLTFTGVPEGPFYQAHSFVPFGTPVSHPISFAFAPQSGRDPYGSYFSQVGRRLVIFSIDVGGPPTDQLVNLRAVRYRGVWKPAGACAAAGLPTYTVIRQPGYPD